MFGILKVKSSTNQAVNINNLTFLRLFVPTYFALKKGRNVGKDK